MRLVKCGKDLQNVHQKTICDICLKNKREKERQRERKEKEKRIYVDMDLCGEDEFELDKHI